MFKPTPTRIIEAVKCQLTGHAHCKQVFHETKKGPVVDHIVHYVRGCRKIENVPVDQGKK